MWRKRGAELPVKSLALHGVALWRSKATPLARRPFNREDTVRRKLLLGVPLTGVKQQAKP